MHKSKENNDTVKDMFYLCDDDLHLLRAALNTEIYLLNYYETIVY